MKLSGVSFFWNTRKNFKLIFVLVLVLKSKALYFLGGRVATRNGWRKKYIALVSSTHPASYSG